jgi:hypothetical protein
VGFVVDFDRSVKETLHRGVKAHIPVRLLIDPWKPKRYFILPFETGPAPGAFGRSGTDAGEVTADPGGDAVRRV